jgi:multicomponent Na+:H+ antiporter subunit C
MILLLSLAVAVLFGAGSYLVLKADLIRVVAGMVLIANAANLFIMAAGLTKGAPPIYPYPLSEETSDPLVQSMTLTAIVISFGVSALLLSLVYRVYHAHRSVDLGALAEAEERQAEAEEEAATEPTASAEVMAGSVE